MNCFFIARRSDSARRSAWPGRKIPDERNAFAGDVETAAREHSLNDAGQRDARARNVVIDQSFGAGSVKMNPLEH